MLLFCSVHSDGVFVSMVSTFSYGKRLACTLATSRGRFIRTEFYIQPSQALIGVRSGVWWVGLTVLRVLCYGKKRKEEKGGGGVHEVLIQRKRLRLPFEWQQEATSFWVESGRTLPVRCRKGLDANWESGRST
jgi:hypothetical protein